MKMNSIGIVSGVENSRPLRIANNLKDLAKAKRAVGNDADAKAFEAGATEIERLYGCLQDALKLAEKAANVRAA